MNLEIGSKVFDTQIGMPGYVANLGKNKISIVFRKYALLREKRQINIGTFGEYEFNYPESFESGKLVLYRDDMISSLYDPFLCHCLSNHQIFTPDRSVHRKIPLYTGISPLGTEMAIYHVKYSIF